MKNNFFIYLCVLMLWTLWLTSCQNDDPIYADGYLTFTAESPMTFSIMNVGNVPAQYEYSLKKGEWKPYVLKEQLEFGGSHGTLRLRGRNSTGTSIDAQNYHTIVVDGPEEAVFSASGDIRTLVDWKNYKSVDTSEARFGRLFLWCEKMVTAPALPATKLASYCYDSMFYGCKKLTKAPELPAKQLSRGCYFFMFCDCFALQETPTLPATEAPDNSYGGMFHGCKGIKKAGSIAATSVGESACHSMFALCDSLIAAPDFSFTSLALHSCRGMFSKCLSLTSVPDILPAKELDFLCYESMFHGCVNLKKGPVLPAEVLKYGCYKGMFGYCINLSEVTMLAYHVEADDVEGWLIGIYESGVLKKSSHLSLEVLNEAKAVPERWSVVDYE
ncbi:MAG: hypothetical protein IJA95_13845 [Bacteroidaceae bacterium]|nr:hypothetical protein [Bacteroidaceae bacterium]